MRKNANKNDLCRGKERGEGDTGKYIVGEGRGGEIQAAREFRNEVDSESASNTRPTSPKVETKVVESTGNQNPLKQQQQQQQQRQQLQQQQQ